MDAAPLRPLGAAEVLDGAVRLVCGNLRAVLAIALPFAIARTAITGVLQYATLSAPNAAFFAAVATLVVASGIGVVLTGLLAPLFSSALLGTRIDARESLRRVGRSVLPLVLLTVVVTVAFGAGFVVAVWLWGIWALAAPALALEHCGAFRALGRSFGLVRDAFWRTWGIRALGWLLTSVLGFLVTVPFEVIAGVVTGTDPIAGSTHVDSPGLYVAILSIGGLVAAALLGPVSSAIDVLLYTDRRMRREGMDIVLGLPPLPAPAAAPAW